MRGQLNHSFVNITSSKVSPVSSSCWQNSTRFTLLGWRIIWQYLVALDVHLSFSRARATEDMLPLGRDFAAFALGLEWLFHRYLA